MNITVALVWGSRSITRTRFPFRDMFRATANVVVVLATPPLRLIIAIVRPTLVLLRRNHR